MGWDPWEDIKKVTKKFERETKRVFKQVEEEAKRLVKIPEPEMPPPPVPGAVPTMGIEGEASIKRKMRKRISGRRKTLVTGDLTPEQVGKKTLLG